MIPNDKEQEEALESMLKLFSFPDEINGSSITTTLSNPFQSVFKIMALLGVALVLLNTQITLLILKLSEVVDWSWITTLSPALSMILAGLIGFLFFRNQIKQTLNL